MNKLQRRQKGLQKARKLLAVYRNTNQLHKEFYEEGGILEKHLINTRVPCSCQMCGNPRKYFGELTRQELKSIEEMKAEIEDLL